MRIGVIGVGHIATDVVRGLLRSGLPAGDVVLAPRGAGVGPLRAAGCAVAADAADAVARADAVLLCVRPFQALDAAAGLPWRAGQLVVSTCAAVPIAALGPVCAPARVVRAMPLGVAAHGASPTILHPDDPDARALLERVGSVISFPREEDLRAATVAGVTYAYAHRLAGICADWLAANGIDPAAARALASADVAAAGVSAGAERERTPQEMAAAMATPGGIAEAAFRVLDAALPADAWDRALDAGLARMLEIERAQRT
jgi:pyrroline-5-carboxylate reductase